MKDFKMKDFKLPIGSAFRFLKQYGYFSHLCIIIGLDKAGDYICFNTSTQRKEHVFSRYLEDHFYRNEADRRCVFYITEDQ